MDESGLYYYGYRSYLKAHFRWLSPDPTGLASGTNSYAMVGNNPISFRDRFGLNVNFYVAAFVTLVVLGIFTYLFKNSSKFFWVNKSSSDQKEFEELKKLLIGLEKKQNSGHKFLKDLDLEKFAIQRKRIFEHFRFLVNYPPVKVEVNNSILIEFSLFLSKNVDEKFFNKQARLIGNGARDVMLTQFVNNPHEERQEIGQKFSILFETGSQLVKVFNAPQHMKASDFLRGGLQRLEPGTKWVITPTLSACSLVFAKQGLDLWMGHIQPLRQKDYNATEEKNNSSFKDHPLSKGETLQDLLISKLITNKKNLIDEFSNMDFQIFGKKDYKSKQVTVIGFYNQNKEKWEFLHQYFNRKTKQTETEIKTIQL